MDGLERGTMTTKRYLKQIKRLDRNIKYRKEQLAELKELSTSIGSLDYSKDIVDTTPTGDGLANKIIKIADLEAEITRKMILYTVTKNQIIEEIESLEDTNYADILMKKYVEDKSLEEVAVEMGYSYDRVRHMHGLALVEFEKIRKDKDDARN